MTDKELSEIKEMCDTAERSGEFTVHTDVAYTLIDYISQLTAERDAAVKERNKWFQSDTGHEWDEFFDEYWTSETENE